MKRYLLFIFDAYYPGGGWHDYINTDDDLWKLVKQGREETRGGFKRHWEVADTETMTLIAHGVDGEQDLPAKANNQDYAT